MVPEHAPAAILSILDVKLSSLVDFLVSNFSSSLRTSLELQLLKEKVALVEKRYGFLEQYQQKACLLPSHDQY